jgi:DNA recombination protein Rad52
MSGFTEAQVAQLSAKLDKSHVKTRQQSGRALSYIEGWQVIAEANRIFGFDAWTSETVDIRMVAEGPRKIGREPNTKPGFGVSYVARVRVAVGGVIREGVGAGHGIDVDLGLAHESAIKEAETDARKRALMTFGNPFGLALYDKAQENVGTAEPVKPAVSERAAAKGPAPKPQAPADVASDPLTDRIVAGLLNAARLANTARDLDKWKSEPDIQATFHDLPRDAKLHASAEVAKIREALAQAEMITA